MKLILLAVAFTVNAQSFQVVNPPVTIAAGSATDEFYLGGANWTQAGAPQGYGTLRFGTTFSYSVPLPIGFYAVTLGFIEPNKTGPGQRVFTVTANGQQTPAIDLYALTGGVNISYQKGLLAFVGAGTMNLIFTATAGNAVVSTITISPSPTMYSFGVMNWAYWLGPPAAGGPGGACPAAGSGAMAVDTYNYFYVCSYANSNTTPPSPVWIRSAEPMTTNFLGPGGARPWQSCHTGVGPLTSATELPTTPFSVTSCFNDTGATVTITAVRCQSDNLGRSTLDVLLNTGQSLVSGTPIICSPNYQAGVVGVTTLPAGGWLTFLFTADGATKQADWVVSGVF